MSNAEDFANADTALNEAALEYQAAPSPGKTASEINKPATTQRDLSLAYIPGVAEPVRRIAADPLDAYRYTNKGNLVAVITDGSAVLGLGGVGPLASKPVMEGKRVHHPEALRSAAAGARGPRRGIGRRGERCRQSSGRLRRWRRRRQP